MSRLGLLALLLPLAIGPAHAGQTIELALPTEQPEQPPQTPVGDPDIPPISLDLFDPGSSREEAWPWPLPTTGN